LGVVRRTASSIRTSRTSDHGRTESSAIWSLPYSGRGCSPPRRIERSALAGRPPRDSHSPGLSVGGPTRRPNYRTLLWCRRVRTVPESHWRESLSGTFAPPRKHARRSRHHLASRCQRHPRTGEDARVTAEEPQRLWGSATELAELLEAMPGGMVFAVRDFALVTLACRLSTRSTAVGVQRRLRSAARSRTPAL
jgi:hypothetical protein